jgi:chromosome segregation ATPase
VQALRAQIAREKEKTKILTAERTALKGQLTSARKTVERIEKAAATAANDADKRQEELAAAQRRFNLPRPAVDALVTMLDGLLREHAVIEQGLKNAQAEAERHIAKSEARAEAAEAGLQDALRENDLLRTSDDTATLISENRRLATALEAANADLEKFRDAATEAKQALKHIRAEIEKQLRLELESGFQTQKNRLNSQVQTLTSQLRAQGKTPLLSPEAASGLVDEFVSKLRDGANGLRVRRGELRLKVAFGSTGELDGFVVPTAENSEALKGNLHEVVLEFDQADKEDQR